MANDSISPADRAECVRMQAERVVGAYRDLREASKHANFDSGDFPIEALRKLFEQIKTLDGWLEGPVDESSKRNSGTQDVDTDTAEVIRLGRRKGVNEEFA